MADSPQSIVPASPIGRRQGDEAAPSLATSSVREACDEGVFAPERRPASPPPRNAHLLSPLPPEPKAMPEQEERLKADPAWQALLNKMEQNREASLQAESKRMGEFFDKREWEVPAQSKSASPAPCTPTSKLEPSAPVITQAHRDAARVRAAAAPMADAGAMQRLVQAQQPARAAL